MTNQTPVARLYKIATQYATGFLVGALVLVALYGVQAWTGPSTAAPGGNVLAPIDTSSTAQTKIGGLLLNTGGAAIGLIVNGFVGIGTASPTQKLSVAGQVSTSYGVVFADGTVQTTAYVPPPIVYLYGNVHTDTDCTAIGSVTGIGGNKYCRVGGSSCPGGWTYMGYNSTSPNTCNGDGRDASPCTTSSHNWSTAGLESCTYWTTYPTSSSRTCYSSYSEVGCY